MTASLQVLLGEIVDYAGLFPPAALSMAEAVSHYARHRRSPERWMLSRFICPATRLEELLGEAASHRGGGVEPWSLSLLGRPEADEQSFLAALGEDLDRAAAVASRRQDWFRFDAWETKLPGALPRGEGALRGLLEGTARELSRRELEIPSIFLEISPSEPDRVTEVSGVLARHNEEGGPLRAGLKIRTGGLVASAFPSPIEVATFVVTARDAKVPMKATAGLHHPLRRHADEVGTRMHGFLNLFGGAALARAHRWSPGDLAGILEEEEPSRFRFDENGLEWKGHRVDLGGLRDTRTLLALSFGSCSFDEPVEDLEALGFLRSS